MNVKVDRRLVLLAGFVICFCISGTSAFSTFVSPLMNETGWDMASVTFTYTIHNIMLCAVGILIGAVGQRFGARALMIAGCAFFSGGWILTGFATEIWMFYLGLGIFAGVGAGCIYNFTITNTLKWFPDKKGTASGIMLGGTAIGPVFAAPAATLLLSHVGVMAAYQVLGVIYGVLMFSVLWFVFVPPTDYRPKGWVPEKTAVVNSVSSRDYKWYEMLKTPMFWMLFAVFVFACAPYTAMLSSVSTVGQEEAGMSLALAAVSVSLFAVSNFAGRLIFGAVSDKIGRYRTLFLVICINVVAIILLGAISTPVLFIVIMCILGACGGAVIVMFPPITSDNFGAKNSVLNYAIMFTGYSTAAFVGPMILSYFKQATGSYSEAYFLCSILMVVAGVILAGVMVMKKRREKA